MYAALPIRRVKVPRPDVLPGRKGCFFARDHVESKFIRAKASRFLRIANDLTTLLSRDVQIIVDQVNVFVLCAVCLGS